MKERILTGDRITGKLHLGHYVGSLKNRVELQDQYETYLLLADVQALTTHFDKPDLIQQNLRQVALDYLSAGIDPDRATIFVQSLIPEIAELTVYFSMFVTVNSLRHNPTIKAEAKERKFDDMYYGFLGYPVSQTADITFCKATLVPVGEDQLPHIEQSRKIVRRFNQLYHTNVLLEPKPLVGEIPRLIGLDGNQKMSKSLDNAIHLDSTPDEVSEKIKRAKTDPSRIHATDIGHPDICPIYAYHQAFRKEESDEIYESCKKGQIGCKECKRRIINGINDMLDPMRDRRITYENNPKRLDEILMSGTQKTRLLAKETMQEVREAMSMNYF
ncbi:tryptophan--tRNA ligase [Paenibacillus thalictri]|uniref:Tryptophan--tRNA ligase n=1 Tax=Paenibacillus thalictri TaxID=2527873 RepID=A0A4Q9DVN3_9BACL|nr:tryptophan--tRNA ligase [Paenibacillus thalictri]TBL79051.1 tryptophan--tRNA ligase [Paenibacillus thalictri]